MHLKDAVADFIKQARELRVAVIGETITDEFIRVSYEGQSMKSICPVLRIEGQERPQLGGAAAIAGHLSDFVHSVTLFSNNPSEIVKTRYVDINSDKKHIEINSFKKIKPITKKFETSGFDVIIVADFGHGFFDGININNGFHLMCQTNSNNFGFNRVSKWRDCKKKSICLDLREASLQINRKISSIRSDTMFELYNYELNTDSLFLTVGSGGSIFTDGKQVIRQSPFGGKIVDTIGAGDTFFAFSSIASSIKIKNKQNIMLVPSLAASLSTTWLANENVITRKSLIKHANQSL